MKSFTDIEQSEKLVEILPIDSADMKYPYFGDGQYGSSAVFGEPIEYSGGKDIPCWSLAAILEIIRNNGRYELQMYEGGYYFEANGFITESYFNAVDTCVEMILDLHKQKLI